MYFQQITEPKLAHNAYLIGCQKTKQAVIIDPQRDIDRYIDFAEERGMKLVAAAETHIHADYLSGLRQCAHEGMHVYMSGESDSKWEYEWIKTPKYSCTKLKNSDSFEVGSVTIQAVHTPGHTPEHLSYILFDTNESDDTPIGILSGDFVFVGDVGRPDLLETAAGIEGEMEPSARELFHSLKYFKNLPHYMQVWPGHGAGSACGKALGAVPTSTVGYELLFNNSIRNASNEEKFVDFILSGQPEPPAYFARMRITNKNGPNILHSIPKPQKIDVNSLKDCANQASKCYIIDTRPWVEFSKQHIPGSLSLPLNKAFTGNAGAFVLADTPIFLIAYDDQIDEVVRDLIRVGLDDIAGYCTPVELVQYIENGGITSATEVIDIPALKIEINNSNSILIDVRSASEYADGTIAGARNIALTRLLPQISDIPRDKTVMINCQVGERSGYASAFLEREGFDVVHVSGGINAWKAAGESLAKI